MQNLIGKRILTELSERTATTFSASQISLTQFSQLEITDLYIADQHNDTLLYAPHAYAELDSLNRRTRFVRLDKLQLTQPLVNISQSNDSVFNFRFLLDSLHNPDKPDSLRWKLSFQDIVLDQGRLNLALKDKEEMSFSHLDFKTHIHKNAISLNELAFVWDDSIVLQKAHAELQIDKDAFMLSELSASTDNSHIALRNVSVRSTGGELKNTPAEDLMFSMQSNNSVLSVRDLVAFLPDGYVVDKDVVVDGKLEGSLLSMSGQNLHLSIDSMLDVRFDIMVDSIAELRDLDFEVNLHDLKLDIVESAEFYKTLYPEAEFDFSPYSHLGTIAYEGQLLGGYNSLETRGKIKTDFGKLGAELSLNMGDSLQALAYKGQLSVSTFQLGKAFKSSDVLGLISGKMWFSGTTNNNGDLKHYFKADIDQLGMMDYDYQNIVLEGGVDRRYFNGNLSINDPNAQMDFRGEVDFHHAEPKFNFTLDLKKLEMVPTHLTENYDELALQFKLDSRITGNKVDDLNGYLNVDSLHIATEHGDFMTDSVHFYFKPLDAMPSIVMGSEYINGLVLGSYNFSEILGYFNASMKKHLKQLPQEFERPNSSTINDFTFAFEIADLQAIAKVLDLPLRSNGFGELSGRVDARSDKYELEAYLPYVMTQSQLMDSVKISIKNSPKSFVSEMDMRRFVFSGEHEMSAINVGFTAKKDTMYFSTYWGNTGDKIYSGNFDAHIWLQHYGRELESVIEVQPSEFVFADSLWHLNKHQIFARSNHLFVDDLVFEKGNSYFKLDGIASDQLTDTLRFEMNQFDLNNLNRFLSVKDFDFGGVMSGKAELYSVLDNPLFVSDLQIDSAHVNASDWGNMTAVSDWDSEMKKLNLFVDCESPLDGSDLLMADGAYYPGNDSLDIVADFDGFNIGFLQPYLKLTMTGVQGRASGQLDVLGSLKNPELYGGLKVEDGHFRIDYLSTDFYLNDTIKFDKNRFVFDQTVVEDQEGNFAQVTGDVVHTAYKNMLVDIAIESDKFLGMNTSAVENEYFYGDIYYGGVITIKSTDTETLIGSNARTVQGSILTIPLAPVSTASKNNFITYAVPQKVEVEEDSHIKLQQIKEKPKKQLIIDMNFNVTPDAILRLEFDPMTGEAIEAIGRGNLNLQFQHGHPFQMFGDYTIEKGEYLFTLQQIFNKNFEINSGSTLQWSGKPGNAIVDITAQYSTRASLYNLMPDAISESNKNRRVPVNVKLLLTQRLSQPNIAFDIDLPNTDEDTQQSVSSIIDTEEEMSRQVLSLLIMNSFYTPDYYTNGAANSQANTQISSVAAVTVSEFLSNQLSNWMSQISDNVDLGFRYTPQQETVGSGLTPKEYEMVISTQFFDDKLTVNGNVGYQDYAAEARPPNVNSNFVGEVDVELKLTENFKLKAYSHQNDDILHENTAMKQGAGVAYEKNFTSLRGWLFKRQGKQDLKAILKEEEDYIDEDNHRDDEDLDPDSNVTNDSITVVDTMIIGL